MKEQFRIGALAQKLGVERFVIRFWEKEFNITSERSHGGQRFYTKKDFEKFKKIKELLYEKGFTIAGAKKIFKQPGTTIRLSPRINTEEAKAISEQIILLQKQLLKLRELL